jgi:hypothetical protein
MNRERRRPGLEEVAPVPAGIIIERFLRDGNITRTARDMIVHRDTVRAILQRHFGTMADAQRAFVIRRCSRPSAEIASLEQHGSYPPMQATFTIAFTRT